MKKLYLVTLSMLVFAVATLASNLTDDFTKGTPEIKSIGSLAFGPEGLLFIGDSQAATIFAIDFADTAPNYEKARLEIKEIDEKIASMLGTTTKDIRIHDLAVNPISQNAYLSVSRGDGNNAAHVLLRITPAGHIEEVSLKNIKYSKKEISNPVSLEAKTRRGRSLRVDAITDLLYTEGEIFIAGLSNEEFSSTLRAVTFPFDEKEAASSLEIFHAAHRRYETNAPIRTFLAYEFGNSPHLLAAYTCTPLVSFPIAGLKEGAHLKGKTVAELGSGNRPLDMILYKNKDKEYILLANSNRTLMKIDPADIEKQEEGLTEPVTERYGTAGVKYLAVAQVGVLQIDNLNDDYILALQRMSNGSLNLRSLPKARL
ncbi:MAG: hypothetical protein ACE5IR_00450 [bacterium]